MATRKPPKRAAAPEPSPAVEPGVGAVELYRSVERLQADLARFLTDANVWKLEIEALRRQIESMQRDRNQAREVLVAMLATARDAGAAANVLSALEVAIRALER